MPPVLPELFLHAAYGLKAYDWSSSTASASEKLAPTVTGSNVVSVIRTWVLGAVASIGLFFTSSWQSNDVGELAEESLWEWAVKIWQGLSELLIRPDVRNVLIIWSIAFWVTLVPLTIALGSSSIIGASLTAWLQAAIFWLFSPVGGLLSGVISVGSLGADCPLAIVPSALIASLVAWVAWSRAIGV